MKASIKSVALGTVAAALDGAAASADLDRGRSWNSPGVVASGLPVIGWGFAPAVQVGSALVGTTMVVTGHESGTGLMCIGYGLMARAGALKLAQRRQKAPAQAQGYRAAAYSPNGAVQVVGVLGKKSRTTSVG